MKLQWKSVSDEQKSKFSLMKERESLIGNKLAYLCYINILCLTYYVLPLEKDVQRTDRTNEYFEGDDNPNLNTMKDILMTYNMYNFDLGKMNLI
jgi:hypothetical protein